MARLGIEPRVSLIPEGGAKLLHYWALIGEESPTPTRPPDSATIPMVFLCRIEWSIAQSNLSGLLGQHNRAHNLWEKINGQTGDRTTGLPNTGRVC